MTPVLKMSRGNGYHLLVLVVVQLNLLTSTAGWRDVHRATLSIQSTVSILQQAASDARIAWAVKWDDLVDEATPKGLKASAQTPSSKHLKEMMSCLNDVYTAKGMTWHGATHNQLGDIAALAGAYSTEDAKVPVTVTTFGSLNRLQQLYSQCLHWRGPLSAVLYEPLLQKPSVKGLTQQSRLALRAAVIRMMQLVSELQRHPDACQLNVLLTYEIVHEEVALSLVPLNLLRNYARLQARTPMIAGLDIDLLPSKSFYERVVADAANLGKQVLKSKNSVFIIPTFDLNKQYYFAAWAEAFSLLDNKEFMVNALNNGIVEPFLKEWWTGHGLTNFEKWKTARSDYATKYEYRCEPWLLTSRTNLPWHDSRFRGWGEDKLQHLLAIYHAGHNFVVLHDSFTIHRVHKVAKAKSLYKDIKLAEGQIAWRPYIDGLFKVQSKRHNDSMPYEPLNPPGLENCLRKLSWWKSP